MFKNILLCRYAGQVGALKCNMKSLTEAHIGDTFRLKDSTVKPLPGFKVAKSMVFAGIYPIDQSQFPELRNALEKLTLNDNAVTVVEESRYSNFNCNFCQKLLSNAQ